MSDRSRTLRSSRDLIAAGLLDPARADEADAVAARYAVAVTPDMAALIKAGDAANDPIAAQFLPDGRELNPTPEERADPIDDAAHSPVKGLVHRYRDRVLLKPLSVCPVYCRFCFRREMVGPGRDGALSEYELETALAYIRAHEEIWEVILSGGDPFLLSPERAARLTRRLAEIPHVKILRWHTRVPVVAPERVTQAFADALQADGAACWVALHANHPRELTHAAKAALKRLAQAGASLLSQTVLLRGVNDDVDTLEALMRGFVEAGVKPYYLHHPDLAPGTSHFRLSIEEGRALTDALKARASGLCQPVYVLDAPGGANKARLSESEAQTRDGAWRVRAADGRMIAYPPRNDPDAV